MHKLNIVEIWKKHLIEMCTVCWNLISQYGISLFSCVKYTCCLTANVSLLQDHGFVSAGPKPSASPSPQRPASQEPTKPSRAVWVWPSPSICGHKLCIVTFYFNCDLCICIVTSTLICDFQISVFASWPQTMHGDLQKYIVTLKKAWWPWPHFDDLQICMARLSACCDQVGTWNKDS